jgi:NADH-quinone oxidoreductase subunit C
MADDANRSEEQAAPEAAGARPGTMPPDHPVLQRLAEAFPNARFEISVGQDVVRVDREELVEFVAACKEQGFDSFRELCAVDYLRRPPHRFEVVIELLSMEHLLRLRILVGVPGADPTLPSITGVFIGANFYEREAYDLFGLSFEGHPDLTRILLPDDWEGHPMRKDHPVGAVPVQFKGANTVT